MLHPRLEMPNEGSARHRPRAFRSARTVTAVGARPAPCRRYVIQLTLEACAGEDRRTISGRNARAESPRTTSVTTPSIRAPRAALVRLQSRDHSRCAAELFPSARPRAVASNRCIQPTEWEDQSSGWASRVPPRGDFFSGAELGGGDSGAPSVLVAGPLGRMCG